MNFDRASLGNGGIPPLVKIYNNSGEKRRTFAIKAARQKMLGGQLEKKQALFSLLINDLLLF